MTSPTPQLNLVCNQGATFKVDVTMYQTDGTTPYSLAGMTFRSQIRRSHGSADVSATPTITILDAANGQFRFSLSATQTSELSSGEYVYDVELVSGSEVTRILQGDLYVDPEVTR